MKKPIHAFLSASLAASLLFACGDDDDVSVDGGGDGPDSGDVIDGGGADAAPEPDAAAGACTPGEVSLSRVEIGTIGETITDIKSPPGDSRIFVLAKNAGDVLIIDGDNNVLDEPFLHVDVATNSERGILGLAFHPQYATNRRFFVFYTPPNGNITIAEGHASAADPNRAEETLVTLIDEPHDAGNHNGGWLDFGPDGYLYINIGDNAKGGQTAQSLESPFGKVFRIDVSQEGSYASPSDNPFVGKQDAREEIWAYGLRNPWRASFDRLTGDFYLADVGQESWEEVNVQAADSDGGENYGWNIMEGTHCNGCDMTGLTLPAHDYSHGSGDASITGGYVYRGKAIPECAGTYFFADYITNKVGSFRWPSGGPIFDLTESWESLGGNAITSWGIDRDGEILLGQGDSVFRLVRGD